MSLSIPFPLSPGRGEFTPELAITYDSGSGNGPFGLGWSLNTPSITRRTDKKLPVYGESGDTYLLSGMDDLVPLLERTPQGTWVHKPEPRNGYVIHRYRPRIEGTFARIERWVRQRDGDTMWRSISNDNVTSWYGRTPESRIVDPTDSSRIYSWLISSTQDDRGNAALYEYRSENSDSVLTDADGNHRAFAHEMNRSIDARATNRYLKRVRYGNSVSTLDANGRNIDPATLADWLFDLVLDYDDGHYASANAANGDGFANVVMDRDEAVKWPRRQDAFSTYRAGFEIRTYRLCKRALMFHHFPEELGRPDYLTRSITFGYEQNPVATYLTSVTERGYESDPLPGEPNRYRIKSFPSVEMDYTRAPRDADLPKLKIEQVQGMDLDSVSFAGQENVSRWVDLDGEGAAGILDNVEGAWLYRRNVSAANVQPGKGDVVAARFEPAQAVMERPAMAANRATALMDLEGDGRLDLVALSPLAGGVHGRTAERGWTLLHPFDQFPTTGPDHSTMRLQDLDGDGIVEMLMADDDALTWYQGLGRAGFGPGRKTWNAAAEDDGPALVFSDSASLLVFADLSGDGLGDLLEVRNTSICYWPNLGYGTFGSKVSMDSPPIFDQPDHFDPGRVVLADIDGSGMTDIAYIGDDGVMFYANQAGNGWSSGKFISLSPSAESPANVQVVDLLGHGTACLVWTSRHPAHTGRSFHYIDLMAGVKPHLLKHYGNGMGLETEVEYRPSTWFYQRDLQRGQPWQTRLAFPVHCLSTVITRDHVRGSRFTTSYTYHHGYFDGTEREFRGFARIERLDAELYTGVGDLDATNLQDPGLHQPPVLTKTWFHTGAPPEAGASLLSPLAHEYWQNSELPELPITEPSLPPSTAQEVGELARGLKGSVLREEKFSVDGSPLGALPYTTTTTTHEVRLLQPRTTNNAAVVLVVPAEEISYDYDRVPADPRISHSIVMQVDDLGLVTDLITISYPRQQPDPLLPLAVQQAQAACLVMRDQTVYSNIVATTDDYRLPSVWDHRGYELTGIALPPGTIMSKATLRQHLAGSVEIPFEATAGNGAEHRLIGHTQTVYLDDDLLTPLADGIQGRLGIVHQSYLLAYTEGLSTQQYGGAVTDADFEEAGYVHRNGDVDWWVPSGTSIFAPDAARHFYLPTGARDPLGSTSTATYDKHHLFTISVVDAAGCESSAHYNYRFLMPDVVTDSNQNRSEVAFDELGMVIASAVMGKAGANEGDTLDDPTSRIDYELFNWRDHNRPNYVHTYQREHHQTAGTRWQETRDYLAGSGEIVLAKDKAEPGIARRWNPVTALVEEVDTSPHPRWIGSGHTVLNNKGSVVKQYEPYFAASVDFDSEPELVQVGETFVTHYDPMDRVVQVDNPDGTFSRSIIEPWLVQQFDENDTVLQSGWYVERGSPDPAGPQPADPETRAAWLAARHANTPTRVHNDALGRTVLGESGSAATGYRTLRTESDITGKCVSLYDSLDRPVSTTYSNMMQTPIHTESAERGERWFFADVVGNAVRTWDDHDRVYRTTYDAMHRPIGSFARDGADPERLLGYVVYGERHPDATARNLNGETYLMLDNAGMVTFTSFDFKGNATAVERRFTTDYKELPDWSTVADQATVQAIEAAAAAKIETETFRAATAFDALNRMTETTLCDGTVIRPTYTEYGMLKSTKVQVGGTGPFVPYLVAQEHDAKRRRIRAEFGNALETHSTYDPKSLRLTHLETRKKGQPVSRSMQLLNYTFDAVGNLVQVEDDAQQTHYFQNAVVKPVQRFEFDELYQLTRATGREHAGLGMDRQRNHVDIPTRRLPHPNNATAVRNYAEEYTYDRLGNLLTLKHAAAGSGWSQRYRYAYQVDPADQSNRLAATSSQGDADGVYSAKYTYDPFGNITSMPHLGTMNWSVQDQLQSVDLGGGGTAWYIYSGSGQRIRKVIERTGRVRHDRRYLGSVEVYREFHSRNLDFERITVSIADDQDRIALIDVKTVDTSGSDSSPLGSGVVRYQFGNHLGSASLEADEDGELVSYEEYHPWGTTSYRSFAPAANHSLKRYRFLGKERDDETHLYFLGSRYYAPWIGRFTSADPAGYAGGMNLYAYGGNNPVTLVDPTGTSPKKLKEGDVNPLNDVSQGMPKWVKTKEDFQKWMPPDNPERPYDPATLTARTVKGKPVFRAEFLDPKTGKPVLPRVGAPGYQTSWGKQIPAKYANANDPKTRLDENEHGTAREQQKAMGAKNADSKTTPTTKSPRAVSLTKTKMDNQQTKQVKSDLAQGKKVDYVKDVVMKSNENFKKASAQHGSPVSDKAIDRQSQMELNAKFSETKLKDVQTELKAKGKAPTPVTTGGSAAGLKSSGGGFAPKVGGFVKGAGTTVAAGLVPGFAEAYAGAQVAPYVVAQAGVTSSAVVNGAAAVAAAPAATATVVVGSAVAGYVVGDIVESHVTPAIGRTGGVGAGTLAGAGSGALIGAAVGSVVPVLGTGVGAVVGGIVGGAAGFIGSYW